MTLENGLVEPLRNLCRKEKEHRICNGMPRLTITYTLPDEQSDFDAARLGRSALTTLWHIDQHCRSLIKHGEPTEEERRLAEQIRAMIPAECLEV